MPRWLSVEFPLLAAGAEEKERQELSRRAESATRAGRLTAMTNVRLKPDTTTSFG
jgi:hypothetical protein